MSVKTLPARLRRDCETWLKCFDVPVSLHGQFGGRIDTEGIHGRR